MLNEVEQTMTKHIGFRCPNDVVEEIERIISETGGDRTSVIVALLRRGLGLSVEIESTSDVKREVVYMRKELNDVQQQLNELRGKLPA